MQFLNYHFRERSFVLFTVFITLADRYVTAIKHGAVPDVDDACTAVAKIENDKIEKEALEIFKNEMEKVTLPASESDFEKRAGSAQHIALDHLRLNVIHDFQANYEMQAQVRYFRYKLWLEASF
jgi:hypothetical protein